MLLSSPFLSAPGARVEIWYFSTAKSQEQREYNCYHLLVSTFFMTSNPTILPRKPPPSPAAPAAPTAAAPAAPTAPAAPGAPPFVSNSATTSDTTSATGSMSHKPSLIQFIPRADSGLTSRPRRPLTASPAALGWTERPPQPPGGPAAPGGSRSPRGGPAAPGGVPQPPGGGPAAPVAPGRGAGTQPPEAFVLSLPQPLLSSSTPGGTNELRGGEGGWTTRTCCSCVVHITSLAPLLTHGKRSSHTYFCTK